MMKALNYNPETMKVFDKRELTTAFDRLQAAKKELEAAEQARREALAREDEAVEEFNKASAAWVELTALEPMRPLGQVVTE